MKDIRIFIASSKELVQERNELSFLVLAKEDEFAQRGQRRAESEHPNSRRKSE